MRYFFLIALFLAAIVVSFAGFRGHKFRERPLIVFPDMDAQARVRPQSVSAFFADGMAARKPVTGTVPMGFTVPSAPTSTDATPPAFGFTHGDTYFDTGRFGDYWGDGMPVEVEVTPEFLARGQARYDIYCAICHGKSGDGKGVTAAYGVPNIANFHLDQFHDAAHPDYRSDGNLFNTITNGKGLMGPYGANLTVHDRWAVIAYVRALQASWRVDHGLVADEFEKSQSTAAPAPGDPAAGTTAAP